jgi:hypothetical protein
MGSRPKSGEQYAALVQQAIYELEDIIEAANFDIDEIDANLEFVEVLLRELRSMRESMRDGSYQFGRRDLPMMRVVKQHSEADLPCIRLFYDINQTHRLGLDVDGD